MTDPSRSDTPRGESRPTPEVADEGGSPGDLEIDRSVIGTGSEAGETWRPREERREEIRRDQTGEGRRSP